MTRTLLSTLFAAAIVASASSASAVTFQLVTQLDAASLNVGVPGSVAAYGDTVYVANLFGGQISRVTDPLGSPANANTFGAALPGNGRVSLSTDGAVLAAASNNAGGGDVLESYVFGTDALNFSNNPAAYGRSRFDGAAVDPSSGNIFVTGFGSGFPVIVDPTTGVAVPGSSPTSLFTGGTGTGFRDVEFDHRNGDIYLKAVNGVAAGSRVGPDDFDRPVSGGAGVDAIVNIADGFNSAINVELVPGAFGGPDAVIFNVRNNANTFADQVLVYDANAIDSQIAATFLNADGSTFTTANADSGIYDFSFDPVNEVLYVSDFSTSQVHVFSVVPEPTGVLLAGLASLTALARRR